MKAREITLSEFDRLFEAHHPVSFASGRFNDLNKSKASQVKAVALFTAEGSPIAGQVFGNRGGIWQAPYSAPFSAPSLAGEISSDEFYKAAIDVLEGDLRLVWPSEFYPVSAPPSACDVTTDYNYHYPLARFDEYVQHLSRAGRYNHNRSLKHNFDFFKTDDIERAYEIIDANRRAMGYPLAMSLDQVSETVRIIPADFFILTLDGRDTASAILFQTASEVMQVIYWGDLPEGRSARAMNHLAWRVFGWYAANRPDIKTIDIGPASSNGVLNEGLAQFKLSIGCCQTPRLTITINREQ